MYSRDSTTTFHLGGSSGILQDKMGANNSSLTPLNCILKNWDRFDPQGLKKTHLVFLYDTAWPQYPFRSDQIRSVAQSCPTLCDPMKRSTPGLPVHHQLPESAQIHVHYVADAIQPSHSLSSPSPPAFNLSQHQGLFK